MNKATNDHKWSISKTDTSRIARKQAYPQSSLTFNIYKSGLSEF